MRPPDAADVGMARAVSAERSLARVRWCGVGFAAAQIAVYPSLRAPGVLPMAVALLLLLTGGNVVVQVAAGRVRGPEGMHRLALAALVLDVTVALAFMFLYAFEVSLGLWVALYILPLEGAAKFQLHGAVATMAAATVLYALKEVYGEAVYGNPVRWRAVAVWMGIGFVIALVAGMMARSLKRERDELEAARAELQRVSDVKDDFLAMTNHELRTPLTTILGYATMLHRRWDTLTEERKLTAVQQVAAQSQRLRDLVEDLLTVASAQAGGLHVEVAPVRVSTVVGDAVRQVFASNGVVNRCPDRLWVLADARRFGQIVINYLSNADKYGAPPIAVDAWGEGGDVVVRVSDAGPGVPPEFVPHLFERFSQSRSSARTAEGTGLGLAIVRQLAQAQGGTVWYEPQATPGASFCLRLPAAPAAVEP